MPLIIPSNSISDVGYEVDNSLRFDDGSSDNLTRTPASAGNQKTFTFSAWIKRSGISGSMNMFGAGADDNNRLLLAFSSDDSIVLQNLVSGVLTTQLGTSQLFRDTSAWYHIVIAYDTTQATDSNRIKIYINGSQVTSFATTNYPSQDSNQQINGAVQHFFAKNKPTTPTNYFDGYMSEVIFVDGQQLDATSFGEFDADSGIWKPKNVSGLTFGTNGFYLDFENSGSLGADVSGNSNNFTVNNLTSIDQTTDTPTNNFATWNPLQYGTFTAGSTTMEDGNLTFTSNETGSNFPIRYSTIAVNSGKWYAEFKVLYDPIGFTIGISDGVPNAYLANTNPNEVGYYYDGRRFGFSSITYDPWGSSFTTNDIIGVAMDLDNNKLYFSKNGTYQESGDPTNGTNGITIPTSATGFYHFAFGDRRTITEPKVSANFGNPPFTISSGNSDANGYGNFEYAVPSGYYALCTKNLAEYG